MSLHKGSRNVGNALLLVVIFLWTSLEFFLLRNVYFFPLILWWWGFAQAINLLIPELSRIPVLPSPLLVNNEQLWFFILKVLLYVLFGFPPITHFCKGEIFPHLLFLLFSPSKSGYARSLLSVVFIFQQLPGLLRGIKQRRMKGQTLWVRVSPVMTLTFFQRF